METLLPMPLAAAPDNNATLIGDLSDTQKSFWKALLPTNMPIRKNTTVKSENGFEVKEEETGKTVDPFTNRLRINKKTTFQLTRRIEGNQTNENGFDPQSAYQHSGAVTYDADFPPPRPAKALRRVHPKMPIYLRTEGEFGGFINWDSDAWHPDIAGSFGGFVSGEDAFPPTPKERFFLWSLNSKPKERGRLPTPAEFTRDLSTESYWRSKYNSGGSSGGIVVDLNSLNAADVLKLIEGLPAPKTP